MSSLLKPEFTVELSISRFSIHTYWYNTESFDIWQYSTKPEQATAMCRLNLQVLFTYEIMMILDPWMDGL